VLVVQVAFAVIERPIVDFDEDVVRAVFEGRVADVGFGKLIEHRTRVAVLKTVGESALKSTPIGSFFRDHPVEVNDHDLIIVLVVDGQQNGSKDEACKKNGTQKGHDQKRFLLDFYAVFAFDDQSYFTHGLG
jgi:hypothetical protein